MKSYVRISLVAHRKELWSCQKQFKTSKVLFEQAGQKVFVNWGELYPVTYIFQLDEFKSNRNKSRGDNSDSRSTNHGLYNALLYIHCILFICISLETYSRKFGADCPRAITFCHIRAQGKTQRHQITIFCNIWWSSVLLHELYWVARVAIVLLNCLSWMVCFQKLINYDPASDIS